MEMDLLELCHSADEEEEFLNDILQQPAFSAESESQSFVVQNNIAAAAAATATAITNEVAEAGKRLRPSSSSPRRYILSFDNAMMVPAATPEESFLGNYSMDPTNVCYKVRNTVFFLDKYNRNITNKIILVKIK